MDTVSAILTLAQRYLHDDGTLWTRTELLSYLNEGYTRLLAETNAIRRFKAYDMPSRTHYAVTFAWEAQYAPSDARTWTLQAQHFSLGPLLATYPWEVEHCDGATPTASANTATQQWERILGGTVENRDRYAYPGDMLSPYRVVYAEERIAATHTAELDRYSGDWEVVTGTPDWYTRGLGRQAEFEVWPDGVAYTQAIEFQGLYGTVRSLSGDRTYTYATAAYGTLRAIRGTVQYVCESLENPGGPAYGIPRAWEGSSSTVLLDYSASGPDLGEADQPLLLPDAFGKYLRYYVVSRALSRIGEGQNLPLAQHYEAKWALGRDLLRRIAHMTRTARSYQQQAAAVSDVKHARPRLPSSYPRVR